MIQRSMKALIGAPLGKGDAGDRKVRSPLRPSQKGDQSVGIADGLFSVDQITDVFLGFIDSHVEGLAHRLE